MCRPAVPLKVICWKGTETSPEGQPELELVRATYRIVLGRALPFGIAQPEVGAFAPGYPAKKLSKLRFSWTITTTFLMYWLGEPLCGSARAKTGGDVLPEEH